MARNNVKKNISFIFFFLAGITLGAFISYVCDGKQYVDWLSWGKRIGFSMDSPMVVDLIVIKFALGFAMKVTIAQIITTILAIIIYSKTCKSL